MKQSDFYLLTNILYAILVSVAKTPWMQLFGSIMWTLTGLMLILSVLSEHLQKKMKKYEKTDRRD